MESSSSLECNICFDSFREGQLVACPYCFEEKGYTCKECAKYYLLHNQEPHCSFCKNAWSERFLYSVFPKSWMDKTYRRHRKKQLLDREKYYLEDTMSRIPDLKGAIKNEKARTDLIQRRAELQEELRTIEKLIAYRSFGSEKAYTRSERVLQQDKNGNAISMEHSGFYGSSHEKAPTTTRLTFVCPCPNPEGCRGMIKAETYECVSCDVKLCKRCHVIQKDDDHECKKSDLETVKFLKKDTKPCPVCATAIHKISGCDQMWCIRCKTAFSWKTGAIETGVVHNPHYYQYVREHGKIERNPGDIPCGGLTDWAILETIDLTKSQKRKARSIHRCTGEVDNIIRAIRGRIVDNFEEFRIDYLTGYITEEQWVRKVFNRERSNQRFKAIIEIMSTFRLLMIETFQRLVEGHSFSSFDAGAKSVRDYFNKTMKEELTILGCKTPPQLSEACPSGNKWMWVGSYIAATGYYREGDYEHNWNTVIVHGY